LLNKVNPVIKWMATDFERCAFVKAYNHCVCNSD